MDIIPPPQQPFLIRDEPPLRQDGGVMVGWYLFAASILFFLCANLILTGVVFLLGGHMTVLIAATSAVLTAVFALSYAGAFFRRPAIAGIIVIIAVAAAFAAAILVVRPIYDISYDGQTYQQEGVIQLSDGWNPVYQNLASSVIGGENKWINYYPKASWINEGYLYLVTHEEQAAKALNIVLIIVSIALVAVALHDSEIVGTFDAWLLALIIGLNPVSVYQALTFYIDGQLASLFIIICALAVIMYARRRRLAYIPWFCALAIFINLKFTALLDALILIVAFMFIFWMKRDERLVVKTFLVGAAAVLVGILIIGASPYLTNTVRYQSPFYPLLGSGSIDLKPYNVPGDYIDKSASEIFFLSFFAQSDELKGVGTTVTYKIPFTYSKGELVAFRYPDADEGGFGPLFGGAFLLALAIMTGFFIWTARGGGNGRPFRRAGYGALAIMIFLVVLCIINPISSLARYVPQGYFIVILPIILLLAVVHERRENVVVPRAALRAVAYVATALLAYNIALLADSNIGYNIRISREISYDLGQLAQASQSQPILVYFNEFKSTRMMLQEAGVNYTVTTDPNACPGGFQLFLPENTTEFCVSSSTVE